jgi:hypothetical protein
MFSTGAAPPVHSGPRRMMPYIAAGWILMSALYASILYYFQGATTIMGLKVDSKQFCAHGQSTCSRVDLFAFQVVSGLALTLCGGLGFLTWHVSKRAHSALPQTPAGRLFGYLPEAEALAALNFMFQAWDFAVSLTIPEHKTAIMLMHHSMASLVAWCSIQHQYLHYYGVFFLGLSEVSSIPLVFLDLAKYFPPVPDTLFDKWIGIVCGPVFCLCFIYYRVVLWWPESWRLFQDVRAVTATGHAEKLRPGATWVLYLFLFCNIPLGCLQLYWLTLILEQIKLVVTGQRN